MIELITTAESIDQAKALVHAGVDTLYIGEDEFGLRLPASFSRQEVEEITKIAHDKQKKVCVAINAIMHNDRINKVVPSAQSLTEIGVDPITVANPGAIHLLKQNDIRMLYRYDT